ncbi:hypothetical protein GOBAR_AA20715 [Gossypium barbadense]|uniref:Uncharacterized protein n=1 Tax=Gossypium barbadense TaxID=3634 RepID=A0A2P5X9D4_GOSBA|nr:hypothetical protein GOBAR_AA20715 [Gossypium barbadense]
MGAHGRVARLCLASFASPTSVITHGLITWPWRLIDPVLGENFALFSHDRIARPCLLLWCEHGLRHARVPGRVDGKTLCFKIHRP